MTFHSAADAMLTYVLFREACPLLQVSTSDENGTAFCLSSGLHDSGNIVLNSSGSVSTNDKGGMLFWTMRTLQDLNQQIPVDSFTLE